MTFFVLRSMWWKMSLPMEEGWAEWSWSKPFYASVIFRSWCVQGKVHLILSIVSQGGRWKGKHLVLSSFSSSESMKSELRWSRLKMPVVSHILFKKREWVSGKDWTNSWRMWLSASGKIQLHKWHRWSINWCCEPWGLWVCCLLQWVTQIFATASSQIKNIWLFFQSFFSPIICCVLLSAPEVY